MEKNPFQAPVPKSEGAVAPIEQHRAIQEVQAAMIIAKKFPRDQHAAFGRIMAACERTKLADAASYDYPKGGTMVTGPSIRLAEVMAQNWGNMEFGIRELSQSDGESEVQAFAWDLETNVRQTKTFKVPHKMKARGAYKVLSDPRDIYEYVANMGARRLRACILGVIPGDIVDAAVSKCEETLTKGDGRPLEDLIRAMLEKFREIGVTKEMIEARLQHKTTAIVRGQLVELGKIYNSIKDGMSNRGNWFDVPNAATSQESEDLTRKIQKSSGAESTEPEWFSTVFNMRNGENFVTAISEKLDEIKALPDELQAKLKDKWERFEGKDKLSGPWPLTPVPEDPETPEPDELTEAEQKGIMAQEVIDSIHEKYSQADIRKAMDQCKEAVPGINFKSYSGAITLQSQLDAGFEAIA